MAELVAGLDAAGGEKDKQKKEMDFDKIYKRAENYFNKIIFDIKNYEFVDKQDRIQIQILIEQAAKIYDKYYNDKKLIEKYAAKKRN